jgi:O-succinylbenzoic acid--CoA ligase
MSKTSIAIRLNSRNYTFDELYFLISEKLSLPQLPQWEFELYSFLDDWLSPTDFIETRTSGSTGEPQTIRLPKTTMEQSARRTIKFFKLQAESRILLSLPCRFIAGKMMVVRTIIGQMDLVMVDPACDLDILLNETFDFGAMVPNQVFKLLESPSGKEKLENIRNLLVGGSAIRATLEDQISNLKNRVVSTYGMTETASHIAIRELSGEQRSDIYHCLPGISVNTDKNDCLQIHISDWAEALQTKDIAEIISPTSFRILGRTDDIIISGGIKYWPETIEKKLKQIISGRFVISSLPDEKLGEKLVLVIEGEQTDSDHIQQITEKLLPSFERPKAIFFLDKFPETTNGKLRRNEIKTVIQAILNTEH